MEGLELIISDCRYVALNTLVKVVAVDNQAVQRHRAIIVNCIKVCLKYVSLQQF